MKFCFNVTANENQDINEPNTATFNMTPNTDLFYWPEDINRIDIDDLHIVILDNDGEREREREREGNRVRERERRGGSFGKLLPFILDAW